MKKFASVLAGLVVAIVATGTLLAADLTIKEVMGKAHKGPNSLLANLGKDLKDDEPEWTDIQKETKELVELGTTLGKNDPPKGDKQSWKNLTKAYLDNAKALDAAAQKKDKATAQSYQAKLAGSCKACHTAHNPNADK
jgi:mono/diheme cytochrome c family protein